MKREDEESQRIRYTQLFEDQLKQLSQQKKQKVSLPRQKEKESVI